MEDKPSTAGHDVVLAAYVGLYTRLFRVMGNWSGEASFGITVIYLDDNIVFANYGDRVLLENRQKVGNRLLLSRYSCEGCSGFAA